MTIKEIIRRVKYHHPVDADEWEDSIGVPLIELGGGSFRDTFAVQGLRLVVKFPKPKEKRAGYARGDWSAACHRNHSRREIDRVRQISRRRSLIHLKRYLPKFYYMNWKTGVIVMEQLKVLDYRSPTEMKEWEKSIELLEKVFKDTFQNRDYPDVSPMNVALVGDQLKVIDLGCV